MKLIGAGLPRTGTLSQKIGLEMLGLAPCYHMVNVLADLNEATRWRQAVDGEISPKEILDGFPATVDWPGSYFTEDLIEIYPDAKVLLSVRDGDGWAKSMQQTVYGVLYGDGLIRHMSDARQCVDPQWVAFIDMVRGMWEGSGMLNGDNTTLETLSSAMDAYNERIKEVVPADRLLVWSVREGWEPLCEFLELPVPDMPFPHVNDAEEFAQRIIDGSILAIQNSRAAAETPVTA